MQENLSKTKTKRMKRNETEETKRNKRRVKTPTLRAPRAGFPARLFRFVSSVPFRFIRFVFVFEKFPSIYVILVI